ncbi:clotting factor G beta subunit-like [Anopheles darlingi]|uniref:clotting factor G beta subunit-like n=1 Tax=Anopheles darlingi TaxID=43151 RepID=UPI0021004C40|nr:clotting factor G beta subunit-like [Anopheles darlingi]XP_049545808.1 clotting factor G beta subunit-like [Anopheles darlingi]
MKYFSCYVTLHLLFIATSASVADLRIPFNITQVSIAKPARYHAIRLFNNDHPNHLRPSLKKCPASNYMFLVKIFSTEEPYFCPAVFISADSLIASALCLKQMQPIDEHPSNHMFVMVEAENVFFYEGGRRYVSKIFFHPKLEENPAYYNMAILKLRNPIRDTGLVNGQSVVACLWSETKLRSDKFYLGEWFKYQPERNAAFRWLELPLISTEECRDELLKSKADVPELDQGITESQVCVKDSKNRSMIEFCEERSSGPLFMTLGDTVYLVGMPTVHIDDCNVRVEVFNRISIVLDWIESVVWPHLE